MGTPWIIEGEIDPRWPINTRGNVGEVFPEVVTALGYELGVKPAEGAWREGYGEMGVYVDGDFTSDNPVIIGLYGGYTYLNLSYLRILGVRAPGSSAQAIDTAFFGEGSPPAYQAQKGDKNLMASLRILRKVNAALGVKELPPIVADSFARSAAFEAKRPDLDATDDELLSYMFSFPEAFKPVFRNHMITTGFAGVISGILADAAIAAGNPGLVTELLGAAGDVRSAQYSQDLYAIASKVREIGPVNAAFDSGVTGLLDRLDGMPEASEFHQAFGSFISAHGHRGPNDWEMSSRTWENTPELALIAIDSMRKAEHDLAPSTRLGDDDVKRQAAIAEIRPHLNFVDKMTFDKAVKAAPYWAQAREGTRDRAVRIINPVKQVFRELVRRGVERGGNPDPVRVALLYPLTELKPYLEDPASMADVLAERGSLFDRFSAITPPFFISAQHDVPTIEQLEADQQISPPGATSGDVLTGSPGCSGVARGRARVVLDPAEATDLEPGEVLVAPLTDPSWTPLFLPAAAVVVNVGALMSHAVIVARELAIPCVVAVEGATDRISTGMLIEVDGTAGTVRIIET